jgi:uncharacterized repeat protein (TIGR02543 family)
VTVFPLAGEVDRIRGTPHMPWQLLKTLLAACLCLAATTASAQVTLYSQPPAALGGLVKSAWLSPNGMDGDVYAYDDFAPASSAAVTEVRWRGGYTYLHSPITEFTISIYAPSTISTQPDISSPVLARWTVPGVAGETPAGTFGSVAMYDYGFTLPAPFQVVGGQRYWLQVEASCTGYPDWAWAYGTGGNGKLFLATTGGTAGGGTLYQVGNSDLAFTLMTSDAPLSTITASSSPVWAGTVTGAGAYPIGSIASLTATAAAGYGLANWTEGAAEVSTSPTYSFAVTADRTLVANFVTAFTIAVAPSVHYAGSASGGGVFNAGVPVTLVAAPSPGFVFVGWEEAGTLWSTSPSWTFTPTNDMALVAVFAHGARTAIFDFDTGSPALVATISGTPLAQTAMGQTAHFSGSSYWSVQSNQTTQWGMPLFSGNWLFPTTPGMTLDVRFDRPLAYVALNFATADFNQMELATPLQVSAYLDPAPALVGVANARGLYMGGAMPAGTLSLGSVTPFNHVVLNLLPCATCSANFFVDNIVAMAVADTAPPTGVRDAPRELALSSPWPNPGSGAVAVAFALPVGGRARLDVLDVGGRRITSIDQDFTAGSHEWQWSGLSSDGLRAGAGLYFVRLTTPWGTRTRRLTRMM